MAKLTVILLALSHQPWTPKATASSSTFFHGHAAINEIPEKHRRKTERNFAKQAVHLLPAWDLLEEHRARSKKSSVPNSAWWLSLE
jgi:hypothetical protein